MSTGWQQTRLQTFKNCTCLKKIARYKIQILYLSWCYEKLKSNPATVTICSRVLQINLGKYIKALAVVLLVITIQ
jgi:hypothetical protein